MADQASNPRITAASAYFMYALVAMEPGTENSGIYANKPGYHGTRAENIARDQRDGDTDYSVEHALDSHGGPDDKAAAYDWTHRSAQSGNYASMRKYGARLRAAFDARDPRLYGWREALGQTDLDATPEGLDFDGWYTRTPDSTHAWHWHLSEHRRFVESMDNKECMLSVLRGESLAAYQARGGKLVSTATTPAPTPPPTTTDWMDKLVRDRLPTLKLGNPDKFSTRLLQACLNVHGYNLHEDGEYGPRTKSAVTSIQSKYSAESKDGICGPETWTIVLTRKDQV